MFDKNVYFEYYSKYCCNIVELIMHFGCHSSVKKGFYLCGTQGLTSFNGVLQQLDKNTLDLP